MSLQWYRPGLILHLIVILMILVLTSLLVIGKQKALIEIIWEYLIVLPDYFWKYSPNYGIKLWDIRKLAATNPKPVFEHQEDTDYSIVNVHFLYTKTKGKQVKSIISCSTDKIMKITDLEGTPRSWIDCKHSYTSMSPLVHMNSTMVDNNKLKQWVVAAGTTKPELILYTVDQETFEIKPFAVSQ